MIGSAAEDVKGGKLFGTFVQYGYDTGKTTGASLKYSADKAFGPAVPEAVAKEVNAMAADFASGKLKVVPTEKDARSGS